MENPKVVQKSPYVLKLNVGTYYQCACGLSKKQPFCDGSHEGTKFSPNVVKIEEEKTVALCACKHSKNGAFCDGTHAKL